MAVPCADGVHHLDLAAFGIQQLAVLVYAQAALAAQGDDDDVACDGVKCQCAFLPGFLARQRQNLMLIEMHDGLHAQHPHLAFLTHEDAAGTGGVKYLGFGVGFQPVHNVFPCGGILNFHAAGVGKGVVTGQGVQPFLAEFVFPPADAHKGAFPVLLYQTVAAAVFTLGVGHDFHTVFGKGGLDLLGVHTHPNRRQEGGGCACKDGSTAGIPACAADGKALVGGLNVIPCFGQTSHGDHAVHTGGANHQQFSFHKMIASLSRLAGSPECPDLRNSACDTAR